MYNTIPGELITKMILDKVTTEERLDISSGKEKPSMCSITLKLKPY